WRREHAHAHSLTGGHEINGRGERQLTEPGSDLRAVSLQGDRRQAQLPDIPVTCTQRAKAGSPTGIGKSLVTARAGSPVRCHSGLTNVVAPSVFQKSSQAGGIV